MVVVVVVVVQAIILAAKSAAHAVAYAARKAGVARDRASKVGVAHPTVAASASDCWKCRGQDS